MTLFTLLTEKRGDILKKCRQKVEVLTGERSGSNPLSNGLSALYEELVEVLRMSLDDDSAETRSRFVKDTITASASRQQANLSYLHGHTVSQLVHCYGCICQGVTEYAHEIGAQITTAEFSQLNLCLDVAIAQAVGEYEVLRLATADRDESLRLGVMAHELRNYLTGAILAHELVRSGKVGAAGATSSVITNAHEQMINIIDRAMAAGRLSNEPTVQRTPISILRLLSGIETAAQFQAKTKAVSLSVEARPDLTVEADPHLLSSAVSNLVNNAIKFTKPNSQVWMRGFADGHEAVIEVEDRCGGLPDGRTEELFVAHAQASPDRTGLGLGLSIARRAVELHGGTLTATDKPGKGCVFTVRVPLMAVSIDPRSAVAGC